MSPVFAAPSLAPGVGEPMDRLIHAAGYQSP
jgi:hypothetical protein